MKSTEHMAQLIKVGHGTEDGLVKTLHGLKTPAELATMIEEQTGIEKLAKATEVLIGMLRFAREAMSDTEPANQISVAITNAHAAVQYYRGDTDDGKPIKDDRMEKALKLLDQLKSDFAKALRTSEGESERVYVRIKKTHKLIEAMEIDAAMGDTNDAD